MQKAWKVDDTTLRFCQDWENWYGSFYELLTVRSFSGGF